MLPSTLMDLGAGYPALEYFVQPASSTDLYHRVLTGDLDAAIIVRPQFALPKTVGWLTVRDELLAFITPQDAAEEDPHLAIAQSRFIRCDRSEWGGQLVDRYLRGPDLTVREWPELDALDAIAALVDKGSGGCHRA